MSKKTDIYYCVDCGIKIKGYGFRCYSCSIRKSNKKRKLLPPNRCIDCNKVITRKSKRCKNCYSFSSRRLQCTRKYLENLYIIKKLSQTQIAKILKISQGAVFYWMKKWKILARPWKAKPIRNCVDCGKQLAKDNSRKGGLRCFICAVKNRSGQNSYFYGKILKPKWCKYNHMKFRSSWEANFAKWLDLSNIKWEYESKTFDLGNCTYTPDFYLPEFDCYIEIKGWWQFLAKKKFKFVQKYFNVNLICLEQKILKNMSII